MIGSFKPKENLSPEYIFLHEVGHLLASRLTGNPDQIPDSFNELGRQLGRHWQEDAVEVFADLFSLSVMIDTELAEHSPFIKVVPVKEQKILKDYYLGLVNELCEK